MNSSRRRRRVSRALEEAALTAAASGEPIAQGVHADADDRAARKGVDRDALARGAARGFDLGADALRFGLLAMSSTQDVRYSDAKVQQGRDLANKMWNASRLVLTNAAEMQPEPRPRTVAQQIHSSGPVMLGPAGEVHEPLSADGNHFVFGSTQKFEADADAYTTTAKLDLPGWGRTPHPESVTRQFRDGTETP